MLVAFGFRFLLNDQQGYRSQRHNLEVGLSGFLVYSIYLMSLQYRFFRRWEKRMNRLQHA